MNPYFLIIGMVLFGIAFIIYLLVKDKDMQLIVLWVILCFQGIIVLLGITIIIFL